MTKLKNFLDQQNQESNLKAQQQAAEIASEQEKQKILLNNQKEEFLNVKKGFENEIKFHKKERENLAGSLSSAKSEIKSLKFELDSLRKSFDNISMIERSKYDAMQLELQNSINQNRLNQNNYRDQNQAAAAAERTAHLHELNVLKQTLERLTNERADLENQNLKLKEDMVKMKEANQKSLDNLSVKYEKEISDYRNEYGKQLDQIEVEGEKSERSIAHYWFCCGVWFFLSK